MLVGIEKEIESIAQQILQDLNLENYFLVQLKISANKHITLLYDADAGGVKINDLTKLNRTIRELIDLKNIFPNGDYSLEVSSYGIDNPLILHRQYLKNKERDIELTLLDGTIKMGTLKSVEDKGIFILEKTSKIKSELFFYEFTNIKSTYLIIKI